MNFLGKIAKKWQFVIYISLITAAIAFIFSALLPPKYRAESSIIIVQRDTDILAASKSVGFLTGIFAKVVYTDSFIEDVLRNSSLLEKFPQDPYERKKSWEKAVKVTQFSQIGILEIKAYGNSKEDAVLLAGLIGDSYLRNGEEYHGYQDKVALKIIDGPLGSPFPVFPNVPLNALAGLAGGFVLATFVILVFDDVTLRIFNFPTKKSKELERLVKEQVEKQITWKNETKKRPVQEKPVKMPSAQEEDYFQLATGNELAETPQVSVEMEKLPENIQLQEETEAAVVSPVKTSTMTESKKNLGPIETVEVVKEVVKEEEQKHEEKQEQAQLAVSEEPFAEKEEGFADFKKYDRIPSYKTLLRQNVEKVIGPLEQDLPEETPADDQLDFSSKQLLVEQDFLKKFESEKPAGKPVSSGVFKIEKNIPFEEETEDSLIKAFQGGQDRQRERVANPDQSATASTVMEKGFSSTKKAAASSFVADKVVDNKKVDTQARESVQQKEKNTPSLPFDPSLLDKLKSRIDQINKKSGFDEADDEGEIRTGLKIEQPEKPVFKSSSYEEFKKDYVPPKEVFAGNPKKDDKEPLDYKGKMKGYGLTSEGVIQQLRDEIRRVKQNRRTTHWEEGTFIEKYKVNDVDAGSQPKNLEPSEEEVKERLNKLLRGEI